MATYKCDICLKIWTRKYDYTRHKNRKTPCKINKYDLLIKKIEELEIQNIKIDEIEKQNKKIEELEKQNIELKSLITTTSIITNNKIDNNINNKFDNNINIIVSPIEFGKEDLSFINNDFSKKILNKGFKSIQELIKIIHFNKDKPEYHNIYLPNWRDKSNILVFDGLKWNLSNKDDILDDLKDKGINYIQKKYEELDETDKKDAIIIKKIKRFLESHDDEDKFDILKKDLLFILYNNRDLIEKTRKLSNKHLLCN